MRIEKDRKKKHILFAKKGASSGEKRVRLEKAGSYFAIVAEILGSGLRRNQFKFAWADVQNGTTKWENPPHTQALRFNARGAFRGLANEVLRKISFGEEHHKPCSKGVQEKGHERRMMTRSVNLLGIPKRGGPQELGLERLAILRKRGKCRKT